MGPRALLLSPDDQAVNAITGVLEEMSVSCERPLDGASAAKKLNSERFDLVLVDCDNLPAAKLIFDVCRRSHGGASVPVAIVDGRVGLPTAFRLGAELILTKPVAKDQARITVRTAVSRIKKDQPLAESKTAGAALDGAASHEQEQGSVAPKAMAQAAGAASGTAPQTVSTAIVLAPPSLPAAETSEPAAASAPTPVMSSAPALSSSATELFERKSPVVAAAEPAIPVVNIAGSSTVVDSKKPSKISAFPAKQAPVEDEATEDPVMEALEKDEPSSQSPIFSAYKQPKPRRGRGTLVTLLVLAILAGGFYAAWMYQPGFREFVQARLSQANALVGPQIQRLVNVAGTTTPTAARQPATAPSAPQRSTPAAPAQTQATPSITPEVQTPETQTAPSVTSTPLPTAASNATSTSPAVVDQKKITAATVASENELPAAKDTVILSSKGAEKRLVHRVAPVVPAAGRAQSAEATVVLKAAIDESGAVTSVQPVEGDPVLADAAIKAVKQWRYKPYARDGKAVPFQTIVIVDFQ